MITESLKSVAILRVIIFYGIYTCSVLIWGVFSFLIWPFFPLKTRFYIVLHSWAPFLLWSLKITCNIRYDIQGIENIPTKPCIVMSNHQSSLETFLIQLLFSPLSTVIKRELLYIPFFGWGLAALKPIAINRSKGKQAMQQLTSIGKLRLTQKMFVLIFPEGTRVHAHRRDQKFSRGGALLAIDAKVPIIPIVHNSGLFWPAHQFRKHQGTVKFIIGKPIDSNGQSSEELTLKVKEWMINHMHEIH